VSRGRSEESKKRPGEDRSIDRVFVGIARDAAGDEGIVGIHTAEGWMPLVCSTRSALQKMEEMARTMADASGEQIHFVRFERGDTFARFKPRPPR